MKFVSFASSSSGNCSLIFNRNFKILIDCGISKRYLEASLASLNLNLNDIDAVLITHAHNDHINIYSFESIVLKNIPVYCSIQSEKRIKEIFAIKKKELNFEHRNLEKNFFVKDCQVNSIKLSHDFPGGGFGFVFESDEKLKRKKISFATDLGIPNADLIQNFLNSDLVFIESNHDVKMLKESKISERLKERISSEEGHLSNEQCSDFANDVISFSSHLPKYLILGHLSEDRNNPELALETTRKVICRYTNRIKTIAADRKNMTGIFEI